MSKVFVIAQGGGPTAVINQTVAGVAIAARQAHPGARVLGARHGVRGIRDGDLIDLTDLSEQDLRRIGNTPNAALGSTRDKPDETYCARILDQLRNVSADAFVYIGGNDTAGTLQILQAQSDGGIAFVHAPKTIDNDLVENDHTPGFISAALFVANAFVSMDLDFRALPGIYVGIVMGRHAGFLTASAAAWRRSDGDGPHLVYVPERPFSVDRFLDDVRGVRQTHGRCVVAMSEGVTTADGRPLVESLIGGELERDAHGNVQLSTGDLGRAVQSALAKAFPKVRARVDTFGYLPRAFAATVSDVDRREAFEAGAFAVGAAESGSCSVTLQNEDGSIELRPVPLAAVAGKTRLMPPEFLEASDNRVSEAGVAYLSRLLPPPPDIFSPFV
ncbi:MAG: diphosphate--fructose-6-phosphate 1-phosphotransferase [Bauldia sp.]|nr:diphosphate--fructose-6-phosphate 1-phosphotransferase [Bauldia sp.]